MGKFKCPHCGHLQNKDGICEGCDLSKVLPLNNKPVFIKGVRYKCDSCNRRFRTYFEICPKCGTGKLMPQYKNHKRLKKSSRFARFVISIFVTAAILFGAYFVLHNHFPDTEELIFRTAAVKISEFKDLLDSYIGIFAHRGIITDAGANDRQNNPLQVTVLPPMLSPGDTAAAGGLKFTVKRMEFSDYPGGMEGYGRKDSDYKYCIVFLDAYNPTPDTIRIRAEEIIDSTALCYFEAALLFDGEVSYAHSFGAHSDFFFENTDVLPKTILTDKIISFKVPAGIVDSDAPLVISIGVPGSETAYWKLR